MKEQLELLIDRHGVANILRNMMIICNERSEKLLHENWPDSALSWATVSKQLYKAAKTVNKLQIY